MAGKILKWVAILGYALLAVMLVACWAYTKNNDASGQTTEAVKMKGREVQ